MFVVGYVGVGFLVFLCFGGGDGSGSGGGGCGFWLGR